jgi:hypothetical protein
MSTPPPTIETFSQDSASRPIDGFARALTSDQILNGSPDELRTKVAELQAAYQEAKMAAAHHRLQYQMLAQESAAAIERMAVEARMMQCENEVINFAEQAKATAATPAHSSPQQEGVIPVQKDLYRQMCREIQQLSDTNAFLETEHRRQEKLIFRQDNEIAGLTDKVLLLRDRIREHREHQNRMRNASLGKFPESTPQLASAYSTPRNITFKSTSQPQPFDALLQASQIASLDEYERRSPAGRGRSKKGHSRGIHSLSSLPVTPNRSRKQPPLFQTPQGGPQTLPLPATAPVPRMSNLRTSEVYAQQRLPVKRVHEPGSDGTVSGSDNEDGNDSEAETEILEPDEIDESQASFTAAQMLRANPQSLSQTPDRNSQPAKRAASNLRQIKLFGTVRKANIARAGGDEPPAKRPRMHEGIGLGIEGLPH